MVGINARRSRHQCLIWRLCTESQGAVYFTLHQSDTLSASSPVAKHHGQRAEQVRDEKQPQRCHRPPPVHPKHSHAIHQLSSHHFSRELIPPAAERIDGQLQPCQRGMPEPVPTGQLILRAQNWVGIIHRAAISRLRLLRVCSCRHMSTASCAGRWAQDAAPADLCFPWANYLQRTSRGLKYEHPGSKQS